MDGGKDSSTYIFILTPAIWVELEVIYSESLARPNKYCPPTPTLLYRPNMPSHLVPPPGLGEEGLEDVYLEAASRLLVYRLRVTGAKQKR